MTSSDDVNLYSHRSKKTSKVKMKLIYQKQQCAQKRSHGSQGIKMKKKFQFVSRKIVGLGRRSRVVGKKLRQAQSRRQVELIKTELKKMKVKMSNSTESLIAAEIEAKQSEAKLEVLSRSRNELFDNLLVLKAMEAIFMSFL